ncbi:hypothetical protein C8R44DRAFT_888738 [Mycena epipterygia]|nr:hypothetical protein C8R44DRAFT_888738 [Mycena epipterygia]
MSRHNSVRNDELNPEHDENDIGLAHTSFLLGLGVCAFLEAALGMESGLVGEMARLLTLGEAHWGGGSANGKGNGGGRCAAGLEWEILNMDAVVLLGLTHALSASSTLLLFTHRTHIDLLAGVCEREWEHGHARCPTLIASRCLAQEEAERRERIRPAEGPVEELIVDGTVFGFGLFNLVFSVLPKKVQ